MEVRAQQQNNDGGRSLPAAARNHLANLPYAPDSESVFSSESVLEYQNKALATLVQKHKVKIDELSFELKRGATERVNLEANLAHLTKKLLMTSKSLETMFAQNFQTGSVNLSLVSLLREQASTDSNNSLYQVLRAILVSPQSRGDEDALMQDESINHGSHDNENVDLKNKTCSQLVKSICTTLEDSMTHMVAAFKQVNNPEQSMQVEETKDVNAPLQKLTSLTEQLNRVQVELAQTQQKLVQAEKRLAAPSSPDKVLSKLQRTEDELQRLRLRLDGRPIPYYKVVHEFFTDKLQNFVEREHICTCNVCCLDIESLKKKAAEEAVAAAELARANAPDSEGGPDDSKIQDHSQAKDASGAVRAGPKMNSKQFEDFTAQIEKLKEDVEIRDACLEQLYHSLEILQGSGKSLISEEVIFKSKSMETLSGQIRTLIDEVEKRENLEEKLSKSQFEFSATQNDKKMINSFKTDMDGVESHLRNLRSENSRLQDELMQMKQQQSRGGSDSQNQARIESLVSSQGKLDRLYKQKAEDYDKQLSRAKDLNTRLTEAEHRAHSAQEKYDECKRNYFKVHDERDKLRTDLDKAKSGASEGAAATDLQSQYDSVKTKLRIRDESLNAANKLIEQLKAEVKVKNDHLEDVYNQLDDMQEEIKRLEVAGSEHQSLVGKLESQQQETQRAKTDLSLRLQQVERELEQSKQLVQEMRAQQEKFAEALTNGQTERDVKTQRIVQQEKQAELQTEVIGALQHELNDARLAQAQNMHSFKVAKESSERAASQLADVNLQLGTLREQQKRVTAQASNDVTDVDIASIKYQAWKPKMTCGDCQAKEVQIFLPCGHMLCQDCIDIITRNRQRKCPFDRHKFTQNEVKPIRWARDD